MDNFIVSARKYRPATFDTVVGQTSITTTLKNAIKNKHLAQAFLFCGPRGVGKTTCARILAKTINCENLSGNTEACNKCESCQSFNASHSLNIYELDAASHNSVDDIRSLVEQVRFAPHQGKYKIYIIDEVHMLSASAFNAFLKTLEEPPSYAIFILATTEKHKIIPTILSRCQIFDFNRIGVEDIAGHLAFVASKENIEAEPDALHIIAQKADGALRDALSIFDQIVSFGGNRLTYKAVLENLNILDYDYYFKVTEDVFNSNVSSVLLTFDEILNNGFDGHNFINGLASHLRDLLVCQDAVTLKLIETSPSVREKYKQQAAACPGPFLLAALDILNKCDVQYKSAKNQRLHVELALLMLCTINAPGLKQNTTAGSVQKAAPAAAVVHSSSSSSSSPSPPPSPSPVKAAAPKTVSISLSRPEAEKNNPEAAKPAENIPDKKFSAEELHTAWKAYAQILLGENKTVLHSIMESNIPELKENFLIHFTAESKSLLQGEKASLLDFLRKRLSNKVIQLEIITPPSTQSEPPPYTTSEIFKKMAEKNPNINDLRNQLGLEIDF